MINFSEFLAATIDYQSYLATYGDARLKVIFNQFDPDKSGTISADKILLAMTKLGKKLSRSEVREILAKHGGTNGDGAVLNYEDFSAILRDMRDSYDW